ncbi:T9SS type A sorting domain-containing protein [Sphingobacterium sp. 1.A.4]|uniref:T9SS type A sorting domain-containing protein n=1 Tax=Sphingobacterium sp. 1.A.4 TaxID=2044603 RepID=UPI000C0C0E3C|nr:T9SS type A sorting domain-containing protein [Sphingobacterium sp. 1.A.4]
MKLELRKISRYALLNIVLLGAMFSYAHASHSSVDTAGTRSNKVAMVASKSRNVAKVNLLAEQSDKLINDVKVLYNPIAGEVTVNFKLNKSNTVVIKIMDALGNEVLNLHNSSLEAGQQSLSFDVNQKLSEGFYFVRVSSGTESVVKRFTVR